MFVRRGVAWRRGVDVRGVVDSIVSAATWSGDARLFSAFSAKDGAAAAGKALLDMLGSSNCSTAAASAVSIGVMAGAGTGAIGFVVSAWRQTVRS